MTDSKISEPAMTRDDVMRETTKHVRRVGTLMLQAIIELQERAVYHDASKFSSEEFEAFAQATPKLRSLTYGTPEYAQALVSIKPALEHHYQMNRHHPEHFGERGIQGMNLLDLIEMLADWKAAGERHADGDLRKSIEMNADRFGYGDEMERLLTSTAVHLGWLHDDEQVGA